MSKWVRLVGGLANGEVKKIDDDQVEILVRKNFPEPQRSARAFNPGLGIGASTVEVKTSRYTRRVIHTPGGDLFFFAIEGFSDFEALYHVLGP